MKLQLVITGALLAAGVLAGSAQAQQEFISIGTGGVTGVYYPTGKAICRLVNKGRKTHGIRCSADATGGSIDNINTIRDREIEFGVAQSDWQFHAYKGTSAFSGQGKYQKLRAIFSIHSEPYTLLARRGSGVKTFTDLKGKRFNVGNPGSGQRATTEIVMGAFGMSMDDFSEASELKGDVMAEALCNDDIDALVYTVGHPSDAIEEVTNTCDVDFVDVAGNEIDKLIAENPYYRVAQIPAGMYQSQESEVVTFGVGATLVSSADVSDDIVYVVVKSVFDKFEDFKKLHPAFSNLTETQMISGGLSAPLHDGAVKYYKERGWM
jgi:TRAP transporter TAXI family solute receptor